MEHRINKQLDLDVGYMTFTPIEVAFWWIGL
jgi:hypothetical protein